VPYISYTDKGIIKYFKLAEDKMSVFGREEHVDFQIRNDSLVSREHFSIEKDRYGFSIIELGASNGTFLNDKRLEANSIVLLKDGDKIRAGKQEFIFRLNVATKMENTKSAMSDVLKQMSQGKGYDTIMSEILGKPKASSNKHQAPPTVRPKS